MRIAQIVDSLDRGGLERLAIDLAVEQLAARHEPSLYCVHGAGALAPEAEQAGIPVTTFEKGSGFSLRVLWEMTRRLRRERAEVVHTHNPGIHHYGAAAARLAGVPVVVNTLHGVSNSQGLPYRFRYYRAVMPLTAEVVYVSDHCRRFFADRRIVPRGKGRVILNGIRLQPFLDQPASLGSQRPRIRFGTLGRMVAVKGHAVLLEAFAVVAKRLPGAELRIVGGGPLLEELAAQVRRLNLSDRVSLEESTTEPAAVLSQLDVFVFSSTSEGLPLVVLEALAAGLPIVSTRVGGVPEVAPEGQVAWFCPPGDPEALAGAMLEAARCPDLAEKGRAARQRAIERFSVARVHRDYERLFAGLLSERGRPGVA
jgi:glycosyltransferase involved in cell wall biosynthesis